MTWWRGQHQRRRTDFRSGRRLGTKDHVAIWKRRHVPRGWNKETYARIPKTLSVRELYVRVEVRGFRVRELVIVTTLTDAGPYSPSRDRPVVPRTAVAT